MSEPGREVVNAAKMSALCQRFGREEVLILLGGGIRVKGRAPVHLLVTVEGDEEAAVLRLGRPMIAAPR